MAETRAPLTAEKATPPTVLFQGVNSVLGQGLSTAVEGECASEGGLSEIRCNVSLDIQELANALAIDQSLSVGFGPMGSIDQKLSFVRSLKVTTTSVVLSVYSRKALGSQRRTDVRFKSGLAISEDVDAFVRAYGDSYVASLTRGGEYIGVYVFYSQTREEQQSLTTSLKASGVFSSVTVGAELQTKIDSFLKSTKVNYSFQQWGSGLSSFAWPEPAGFIDYALKFPSFNLDSPRIIGFSTAGYETVPGCGSSFDKVALNRTYLGGDEVVGGLAEKLVTMTQISDQIRWLEGIYGQYGYRADTVLSENKALVAAEIAAVQAQMSAYLSKATSDFPPLTLQSLARGTPVLGVPVVSEPPVWGGPGGGPFNDVDLTTYIQRKTRITAIGLRGGDHVDRLSVTYSDSTGRQDTLSHGGNGGADQGTLQLLEGEGLSQIAGRSGARLDRVVFATSGGRSIAAGSASGGSPFGPWLVPDGAFVMGFKGRCGAEIDALQVIYASLTPARWTVDL